MDRSHATMLLIAAALVTAPPAAHAELLASFHETAQGTDTGHAYFDVGDVDLVLGDDLARLFDDVSVPPTQTPLLFEATSQSDPAFDAVAALLTNGEPDEFVIELTGASGGGIGVGTNDCALFHGDYECNAGVDMQGGSIDRITLEVLRLELAPIDPYGTDIVFEVALEVFGAPEPIATPSGVAVLAAIAGYAVWKRREERRETS